MTTPVSLFVVLVVVDLGVILAMTVALGAWAPRWPDAWLTRDRGPLRLTPLDTLSVYRRLGVPGWGRRLPELGGLFGTSKRSLPGRSRNALSAHVIELRRAEWVHWLSLLGLLPLAAFNPWWLWLGFAVVSCAANAPFLALLRCNRVRLLGLVGRLA